MSLPERSTAGGLSNFGGATWHDSFARCPECKHATVGLSKPYAINHAAGCSMPPATDDEVERSTADPVKAARALLMLPYEDFAQAVVEDPSLRDTLWDALDAEHALSGGSGEVPAGLTGPDGERIDREASSLRGSTPGHEGGRDDG